MNDLSNNPYLIGIDVDWKHYDLNSYLFNQSTPSVDVSIDRLYFLVREMLAYLKFDITLLGYRYLAKLMQYYLVCDNGLNLDNGFTFVSERYGIECSFVKSNINKAIEVNKSFRPLATKMLSMELSEKECGEVASVVMILGAIFKRYYNCNVVGDTETEEDKILLIHKNRLLING
ncbi:MAG: hypothetical protein J1F39_00315 [Clostridiales bacterium]|nr:hypothetical protein [Clostridiales bacterium]